MEGPQILSDLSPDVAKFVVALIVGNLTLIGSVASFLLKTFIDFKVLTNKVSTLEKVVSDQKADLDAAHEKIRDFRKSG